MTDEQSVRSNIDHELRNRCLVSLGFMLVDEVYQPNESLGFLQGNTDYKTIPVDRLKPEISFSEKTFLYTVMFSKSAVSFSRLLMMYDIKYYTYYDRLVELKLEEKMDHRNKVIVKILSNG